MLGRRKGGPEFTWLPLSVYSECPNWSSLPPRFVCLAHSSCVLYVFFVTCFYFLCTFSLRCFFVKTVYPARGIVCGAATCVFLCNFFNCVVTTSSLPSRLVYGCENKNQNRYIELFGVSGFRGMVLGLSA